MKILILSFYYPPDLSAGSFRTSALVNQMKQFLTEGDSIDIVTTLPNRYRKFKTDASQIEVNGYETIHRIKLSKHKSGFIDQSISFLFYTYYTLKYVRNKKYDLVYATSSRLFTGMLGALIARFKSVPLYLDIRDIFTDTMDSLLPSILKKIFLPIFLFVEKVTFRTANKINIVSEGFDQHIRSIVPNVNLSCYTNGIDEEFIDKSFDKADTVISKKIITYAGNIGKGQGLELIIPTISNLLGDEYEFRIIGDGGSRLLLEAEIEKNKLKNIVLIDPVNRETLYRFYKETDYLFLHLNDVPAFEKVLPSKIFEYAATGKPMLAGVSGYSRSFLEENVDNVMLFNPCDGDDFIKKIVDFHGEFNYRREFCSKFSRTVIMNEMASDVLSIN